MVELITSLRSPAPANQPALTVEPDPNGMGWCVSAHSLRPDLVASVGARIECVLRVMVADAGAVDVEDELSNDRRARFEFAVHRMPDFDRGRRFLAGEGIGNSIEG